MRTAFFSTCAGKESPMTTRLFCILILATLIGVPAAGEEATPVTAGTAPAAVPMDLATIGLAVAPTEVRSSSAEPPCATSQAASELIPINPAPRSTVEICGSCSQGVCQNRNVGAYCSQYQLGTCEPYYTCGGASGPPRCQCIALPY